MPLKNSTPINPAAMRIDYSPLVRAQQAKSAGMMKLSGAVKAGIEKAQDKRKKSLEDAQSLKIVKAMVGSDTDLQERLKASGIDINELDKNVNTQELLGLVAQLQKAKEAEKMASSEIGLKEAMAKKARAEARGRRLENKALRNLDGEPEEWEPSKAMYNRATGQTEMGQVSKKTGKIKWLNADAAPKKQLTTGQNAEGENVQGWADENGNFTPIVDDEGKNLAPLPKEQITYNRDEPTPEPGYVNVRDEDGKIIRQDIIKGSPAESKKIAAKRTEELERSTKKQQAAIYAGMVMEDVDRAVERIKDSPWFSTGFLGGQVFANIGGTHANDIRLLLSGIKANLSFRRLRAIKESGATLGQVSEVEINLLMDSYGSVEQSQSPEQLIYNLKRVKEMYNVALHGTKTSPWAYKGYEPSKYADMSDDELLNSLSKKE
tara:strand:- start:1183 stop:2484 length:1302 start_codon:yes stop_codon:yes gene_type:complete